MNLIVKVKDFSKGCWGDFKQALNDSKGSDLVEKTKEVIPNNIKRVFGNKVKNAYVIVGIIFPMVVTMTYHNFMVPKNIIYSISSGTVIEDDMNSKDSKIRELEIENATLKGINAQITKMCEVSKKK